METLAKPRILIVDDLPENTLRISRAIKHIDAEGLTTSPLEAYNLTKEYYFAVSIHFLNLFLCW